MSAPQTVDRILDSFDGERQAQVRLMLAESLKAVMAHRLIRRKDGKGRALALELLMGTQAVSSLIRERKTFQLATVIQTAKADGMQSMDDSILALVRDGVISPQDATTHLTHRELLRSLLRPVATGPAKAAG